MSDEDLKTLKIQTEKSGFKSESAYIRFLIYNTPAKDPEIRQLLNKLIYEINKIGVNINQITRDYNTFLLTRTEKDQLDMHMRQIEKLVSEVQKELHISK